MFMAIKKTAAVFLTIALLLTILPFNAAHTLLYAQATEVTNEKSHNIAVSGNQYYVIKNDGSLWAWGDGRQEWLIDTRIKVDCYLGNGTVEGYIAPVKLMDDVVSISAYGCKRLAVKKDGTVWFWGNDTFTMSKASIDSNGRGGFGNYNSSLLSKPYKDYVWPNVEYLAPGVVAELQGMDRVYSTPVQLPIDDAVWAGQGGITTFDTSYVTRTETAFIIKSDQTLWSIVRGSATKIADNVKAVDGNFIIKTNGELWTISPINSGEVGYSPYIEGTWDRDEIKYFLNSPVHVMDDVKRVSWKHPYTTLKSDGTLWTWGLVYNGIAALGFDKALRGQETAFLPPTKILDNVKDFRVAGIVGKPNVVFYTKADGSLWLFGDTTSGTIHVPEGPFDAICKPGNYEAPVKVADDVADFYMDIGYGDYSNRRYNGLLITIKRDGSVYQYKSKEGLVRITDGAMLPNTSPVPDVPSAWAEAQINAAIAAKLVPQVLQSKYKQSATRTDFCVLAVAVYENIKGEITERKTFADSNDVNVEKAAAIGVVSGTDTAKNLFSPNAQLTREQAAAMLARLANAIGKSLPIQASVAADKDSFSSWAVEAIGQVQAAGIMSSTSTSGNVFSPKGSYTREQSIVTIQRLYNFVK